MRERTSLVVQWLRLWASSVRGVGLISERTTKILDAEWCSQKKKKSSSGTVGFLSKHIFSFSIYCHILFQNNCSNLYSLGSSLLTYLR